MTSLGVIESSQFVEGSPHFEGIFVETVFPGLYLLNLVSLSVGLDAVRAQRLKAVDIDAEIGELFTRMLHALQS